MEFFEREANRLKNLINYIRMYNPLETWSSICGHLLCASYTDDAEIFKFYWMWKEYKINLPYKEQNQEALKYLEEITGYSAKIFYNVVEYLFVDTKEKKHFLIFLYTPFSKESYEQKYGVTAYDGSVYFKSNKKIKDIKDKENGNIKIVYYQLDNNEFNIIYTKNTFEYYLYNLTIFEHSNRSVFEIHKDKAENYTTGFCNLENRKKTLNVLYSLCELLSYMNYLGKEKEIMKIIQKLKKKQCLYLFDKYIDVLEEYRNTPEKIDGRRKKGGFSIPDRIKLKDILLNIKFDIQKRHNWNAEDYIYSFYCTYNPILCLEEISDGVSFVNEILQEYKEKLGVRKYPDYL